MRVLSFLIIIQSCGNAREIQVANQIAVAFRGRMLADIKVAKERLELVFLVDVLVIFEHG